MGIDQSKHLSNQDLCKQNNEFEKWQSGDPNLCGKNETNFDQTLNM